MRPRIKTLSSHVISGISVSDLLQDLFKMEWDSIVDETEDASRKPWLTLCGSQRVNEEGTDEEGANEILEAVFPTDDPLCVWTLSSNEEKLPIDELVFLRWWTS